jgi:hypothetical protein
MAKKSKRKYSKGSGAEVETEMHRFKRGKAKSGPGGKGGKVKSRKQAIAIGLSKARKEGKKVPEKEVLIGAERIRGSAGRGALVGASQPVSMISQ